MSTPIVDTRTLRSIPLLADLPEEEYESIVSIGRRVTFQPGQVIVERSEPCDGLYVVLRGMAQLDAGGRYHNLGAGSFFGEMGLISRKPRMATVIAIEALDALKICADDFEAFLLQHPRLAVTMLRNVVERLREVEERVDALMAMR
ncbi:MAG: cyclic nucleotide-binding domain-containing protein [Actinobacteria bacterium]|nr:cyclic nucleotide-binding domain-containing protein [Actinomycetota bacterium]